MSERYAVVGHPVAHSLSPLIHGLFAAATGQDIEYTKIECALDGFAATVEGFRAAGGRGLNVTVPFKVQALQLATRPQPAARAAGAANALRFAAGEIEAENFDGLALVRDLTHNLGTPLAGVRVLLLGAGGAARGALRPLLAERPAVLVVVNRDVAKARQVVGELGHEPRARWCGYGDLGDERFDIVIDGTSASLHGELPPIAASVFAPGASAYEMVYGKGLTPFLRLARQAGATRLADGVGMLVEQAAEAFAWWRGVRPATAPVIERLAVPLA
ncbi:MAG: shikimate dehydrogenase [Proteobacteria bacterium]|nr:shikimate dehydrogenase [Pseudomonadota bacterium]